MNETLHLTQKELTSVKETLYEFLTLILQEADCEYIIDMPVQKFLLSIDCQKKEAVCYAGEESFPINKHAKATALTSNTDELEFALYRLFKETGAPALKKSFMEKVSQRKRIHDEISQNEEIKAVSAPVSAPLPLTLPKQDEFKQLFDEIITKLGYRAKTTDVRLNATGQLTITGFPEKFLVVLEEKIRDFDENVFIHKIEYNTVTKHPVYSYNGQELPLEDMIASTSCSVDFKKAADVIFTTLDNKIKGQDVLKEESPAPTDSFENFKKSHIE